MKLSLPRWMTVQLPRSLALYPIIGAIYICLALAAVSSFPLHWSMALLIGSLALANLSDWIRAISCAREIAAAIEEAEADNLLLNDYNPYNN